MFLCLHFAEAQVTEKVDVPYEIKWKGIEKHAQRVVLKSASRIESLQDTPPPSIPLLQKRVDDDLTRLTLLMQANGYYLASMDAAIDKSTTPITVTLICKPGRLFTIGNQTFHYVGNHAPEKPWTPYLKSTDPASTRAIEESEARMLRHFKNNGHPFPRILSKDYVLDEEKTNMDIHYEIDPGRPMRMGHLQIAGLSAVHEKAILRQVSWQLGDRYDLRQVESFEKDLILTGLFSKVELSPLVSKELPNQIDFTLTVTERYFRTLSFGVNYRSDVGWGAKSSWEHRNIFGYGERFKLDLTVSEDESIAAAAIRKPGFQIQNQSLLLGATASEETPDAYTSLSFESYVGLERTYTRKFSTQIGLAYKYSTVEQIGEEEIYGLLSLPLQSHWDSTRNDLNPLTGHRLTAQVVPYTDLLNDDLNFGRLQLIGSRYLTIRSRPQLVLAGRATLGSLVGADSGDIPADERFYAGGGGSVRGFTYQSIGPREEGEIVGGTSLMELSLELRARLTETWGFATFVDGGMVTSEDSPFSDEPIQWGSGVGLRIFTGLGPLRLDLAYPLNPNDDQESRLQFYISLGQSF
ncbi:BamA/TamA family outer membrane protein [Kiritimatiellaeota bacterium B1221]|nr:BamA/TamA family outer membrane protein [Kiritimatiellaeota bacterium B1221]